ncbi:MAG: hypothetical protein E6767_19235 [Dysgonomonas sp.]|nr:hypothetical protein [Dysgonomonas sp.]
MHTTKFTIEDYLAEYLRGKWGIKDENGESTQVVRIPEEIYLYDTLSCLTMKKPRKAAAPAGNLEIIIPHRREGNKKPSVYNYISERGAKIFNKKVKLFFRSELHEFLDYMKHEEGIAYKDACFMFVSKYGIESFDSESAEKNHSRWRKKVRDRKKAYSTR